MSLIAPARLVLSDAEKQNKILGHENLGFLSTEYGLMPKEPPLLALPKSYQAWDEAIALLPSLYKQVSIRRMLNDLPLLSADVSILPDQYLYRANTLLGLLSQAYYRGQFGLPSSIPQTILKPLSEIAIRLGRPHPGLTFNDITICNWKFKDTKNPQRTVEHMSLLFNIFSLPEDERFNLVITEMYAVASPLILSLVKAQEAMLSENVIALQEELFFIADILKNLMISFRKIELPQYATLSFNPVVWAKTTGYFTSPTEDRSPRLSGSATAFIHLLDAFLGRTQYNTKLGIAEKRLTYLVDSLHLKNFLKAIETTPLNDYVAKKKNKELSGTIMYFMEMYAGRRGFLSLHRHKVFGFLESAMKMGVSTTPGGFEAKDVLSQRGWHKINGRLKSSEDEHLQTVPCRYPLVSQSSRAEKGLFPMIQLDLHDSGLRYVEGDYLNVFFLNDDEAVEKVLSLFDVPRDHKVYLTTFWLKWLKRFSEYDDISESITITQFFRLARLRSMTKASLQELYTVTKIDKIASLLARGDYTQWDLAAVLQLIKEESLYNINRFVYAEAWLPENISKWLTHASFRHTTAFKSKDKVCAIVSSMGHPQEMARLNLSQDHFYISIEPSVHFNLHNKPGPLVMFAADEGLTSFISIVDDFLTNKHNVPLYLFVVLSDFFEKERIQNIKKWLSNPKIQVTIIDKHIPVNEMMPDLAKTLQNKDAMTLLWKLMRSQKDGGDEGFFFICGQNEFVKNIVSILEEVVRAHYGNEENGVGVELFLTSIRAKHRCEMNVLPSLLPSANADQYIPVSEVVLHNNIEKGYWIIVNRSVYDITQFIHFHRGGPTILTNQAGRDATAEYDGVEHHKNELIQSMLSMYKIGYVQEFYFGHAWGVAPVDGQYIFMTVKSFWTLWTQRLYLFVEMENALHNMFNYYSAIATVWEDADSDLILYKMQATADCHNTFFHTYLQEVFNRLPNLWAVTASMCSLKEDLFSLQETYEQIQSEDAYEQCAHMTVILVEYIQELLDKKVELAWSHQQYNTLLDELLMLDKKIISDLKLELRQGLMAFETHSVQVLENGQTTLLGCLNNSATLLKKYCLDIQKIHYQFVKSLPKNQT